MLDFPPMCWYLSFYLSMLVLPELPLVLKSISNQEIMSGEFLPGNDVGRGKFLSCGIHLYSLGGGGCFRKHKKRYNSLFGY